MKKIYTSLRQVWYNYFPVFSPEWEYLLSSVALHRGKPPSVSGDGCTELDQCFWQKVEFGESWSLNLLFLWSLSRCKSITMFPTPQSQQLQWVSDFSSWSPPFVTIGQLLLVMALCSHAYITGLILGLLLPLPFCVCIRLNLALIQIK